MKKLMSKSLVAGLVAASAFVAVPAQAAAETDHCLEPPYTAQLIIYCGCVAVAGGLSPVIPPSSWDCNPPR